MGAGGASSAALASADSIDGTSGAVGGAQDDGDADLNAELARFMIRTEPLGTDRHHARYWYMQVSDGMC